MNFLFDESSDARLAFHLRSLGHDATVIGLDYPAGLDDEAILYLARRQQRIVITNDLDFGKLIVVDQQPHAGVILFRLSPYADLTTKVNRLEYVLTYHAMQLNQLLVVTRERVRVRDSAHPPGGAR